MKFAILSAVAAAALVISNGSASAQPRHYNQGYTYGHPGGHYHYQNGYYRPAPLVPVYPTYIYPSYTSYPSYNSGFGLTITQPGFSFSIGNAAVTPLYNYGGLYSPYGRRW